MLRNLFTNVMALLITLHALLGCCWHHAHGNEHAAALSHVAEGRKPSGEVAHAECDHCHPGDDHGTPDKPDNCRAQCGNVCTFLPSQKLQLVAPPMTVAHDRVVVAEAVPQACTFATTDFNRQRSEPPLRLHLLHQLLLI